MKYAKIDNLNKSLSRLAYGTANRRVLGEDAIEAVACLDAAFDAGFRVFDTAHSYGNAEKNLGAWMASRGLRDEIVLLDKGLNTGISFQGKLIGPNEVFSASIIREQVEESLKRLRTDYIDMYVLHRDDPSKPVDEIIEVLNELKKNGVIGLFGASNWTFYRLKEAEAYAKEHGLDTFSAVSPSYSLADYTRDPWGGSVTLSGPGQQDYRDWLAENQLPVFAYSSLGRGYLSGKFRTDSGKAIEECLWFAPIQEYD
ncbi:MAG: aldo/keto reductase, partial [Synergistes sp.]|nr:aldo/keto reductase [Synergistes sp.]